MSDEYDEFAGLDEAISNYGPTEEFDTSGVQMPEADNSDISYTPPTENDVMPVGERVSMGEGMGFATRNADGSITYEDPDGSPAYTKTPAGNFVTSTADGQITYNPSTGKFTDAAGKAYTPGTGGFTIPKGFQSLFKTNGEYDVNKILPLLAGGIGAMGSNDNTRPTGYQGKIPKYTATRQAPGIGQLLSGNVLFKNAAGETVNPNTAAPATAVAPQRGIDALAGPHAPSSADWMSGDMPDSLAHMRGAIGNREAVRPVDAPEAVMRPVTGEAQPYARGGMLESGGFVIPADVVSHIGNGSSEAGLRLLAQRYGATPIKGKGDGMSDSIKTTIDGRQPARVANEEARLTKAQVQAAGGAQKLYAMMDKIRQARTGTKKQGKQIDPHKYMPGGAVSGYAAGGPTLPAGTVGTESNLSNWAGDYVTDMLGKAQALAEAPYEQYQGPLTAGPSALQNKAFTGLQNVNFPGNLGQSFSAAGAPTIGAGGQPAGGGGIAQQYMNPYLSAVLNPQLEEMRRQAQINNLSGLGQFTKSGAFGGGRQAIMESENARNLGQQQNKAIAEGYANAYDKAVGQFNTEQGQAKTLADLIAQQGATQRNIEADKVAADKTQFEEARANPYKMLEFQRAALSGLPLQAQTFNQAPTDNLTQFANSFKTVNELLKTLNQG